MKYLVIVILLVIGGIVLVARFQSDTNRSGGNNQTAVQSTLATQTNSEGSVTVEITPVDVSAVSGVWKFKIALNTHSEELNQDLTQTIVLQDNTGKVYKPTAWEGTPAGGHHREGTLIFSSVPAKSPSISLLVKNIGGVPDRKFTWKIGGE